MVEDILEGSQPAEAYWSSAVVCTKEGKKKQSTSTDRRVVLILAISIGVIIGLAGFGYYLLHRHK